MSDYVVRLAVAGDLSALIAMRTDAEAWLAARGIQQWTNHERGVRTIRAGIEAGTTRVVVDAAAPDDPVATLTIAGPDLDFWGPEDAPDTALYVYKLMVDRARGRGLGPAMLDYACAAAQAIGLPWVRLDCWRDNFDLQAYYSRLGFERVRIMTVPGRDSGALMQRPASMRTALIVLRDLIPT